MVGIKLEDLGRAQYPLGSGLALGGRTLYMGKVSWIDYQSLLPLVSFLMEPKGFVNEDKWSTLYTTASILNIDTICHIINLSEGIPTLFLLIFPLGYDVW
jgi:hypothetical protein